LAHGLKAGRLARPLNPALRKNMSFKVGDIVGDYEVVGELGRGGMGRVYKVRNTLSNRPEAMKVLLSESLGTADQSERFLREIRVQASLDHPNIAALRTALRIDDQLVMIMELVEGKSLQAMAASGPLPPKLVIGYICQTLSALSYAHQHGVIHRDIKPGNILLALDGTVKITDFGIAKAGADRSLTTAGAAMGSVYYMSPEQVRGSSVDARSDIYSVGVTLYELLTGSRPFEGSHDYAIMSTHINQAPVPPHEKNASIPLELSQAVLKALAKDPANRFQTATAFREALQKIHGVPDEVAGRTAIAGPGVPQAGTGQAPRVATSYLTASERSSTATLEMAYVLFMDIVAYSSLPMDRQTERISTLVEIVRATGEFRRAQENDQIISLPTGDGMALVFFQNPIAAVQCATEVSRALASHPEIKLRMGIHTGPVYRIADINTNRNVAGGGINVAQRVMDCGDAGHILVSKSVADTLEQLSDWAESFHDLGQVEVKHGVKLHIVNYCTREVGNPELPQKLRLATAARAQTEAPPSGPAPKPLAGRDHTPVASPGQSPDVTTPSGPIPAPIARPSRKRLWTAVGIGVAVLIVVGVTETLHRTPARPGRNPASPASLAPSVPLSPKLPAPPSGTPPNAMPPASIPSAPSSAARIAPSAAPAKAVAARPARVRRGVPVARQRAAEPQAAQPPSSSPPHASADEAQLQGLRERMILLAGRAGAIRSSLETLQQQQNAMGVSLRGDMAAAKATMDYSLAEARNALAAGDAASAKKSLDLAEQQVEKLERFLGR
jgi:class 3 adenylate cyclase